MFLEFKKAVKLVVETVHFDKSNVVQVPVFHFRLFFLSWQKCCGYPDPSFCFVADPELDPDPTLSYTHVDFYSQQSTLF